MERCMLILFARKPVAPVTKIVLSLRNWRTLNDSIGYRINLKESRARIRGSRRAFRTNIANMPMAAFITIVQRISV